MRLIHHDVQWKYFCLSIKTSSVALSGLLTNDNTLMMDIYNLCIKAKLADTKVEASLYSQSIINLIKYGEINKCDRAWENQSYFHLKFDLILRV